MKGLENKRGAAHDADPSLNSCINGEINTNLRYKNYVPLDYFKADIIGIDNEEILNNNLLQFSLNVFKKSGEIVMHQNKKGNPKKYNEIAIYKGLKFKYFPHNQKIQLSGSLHSFYNDGEHNHNDFNLSAFRDVLIELYCLFGITPSNLYLYQLEWAVNLQKFFATNLLIDHVLFHNWRPVESKYDSLEGRYIQAGAKSSFYAKLYNKGLHKKVGYDILRFERKQVNWKAYCDYQKIGRTLNDLIQSNFKGLKESLLTTWDDLLIFDPFIKDKGQRQMRYRDSLYWKDLCKKVKEGKRSRTTRINHLNKLRKYNEIMGANIQSKVHDLIEQKIESSNDIRFTLLDFNYTSETLTLHYPIINNHYGIIS